MSNAIDDEMDNQHAHASGPSELGGRQGSTDCWFFKLGRTYYILTHSIWQSQPLFRRSKWNMGEILAFLA